MSTWKRITRLMSDGSVDSTFNFNLGTGADAEVRTAGVLKTGHIVVGGSFANIGGNARSKLAVLNSNGSLHALDIQADAAVQTLVVQADGKVTAGGGFTTAAAIIRNRIVRLSPGGAALLELEAAYDPNTDGAVHAAALQPDGKTIVGGAFTTVGGTSRNRIARLLNQEASAPLIVNDAQTVTWLRGGTAPETLRVAFELSTDGGTTWSDLGGTVERISGGWRVTGLSLSGDGLVRARAHVSDGHSDGLMEAVQAFDFDPQLQVVIEGTARVTGSAFNFGSIQSGTSKEIEITLRNGGLGPLTLDDPPVTLGGTAASEFEIVEQPLSPVEAHKPVAFKLRFIPSSAGLKNGVTLSIASDDEASPFTLALSGTGLPGPGSLDTAWEPTTNGTVGVLALQPEGILAAGNFNTLNGWGRKNYGRLNFANVLVHHTGAGANNSITVGMQMPDGGWILHGEFTTVDNVARKVARFDANGKVDTSWNITLNGKTSVGMGQVTAIEVLPDHSVIIGGDFTSVATTGVTAKPRRYIAKIKADGKLDSTWDASASLHGWPVSFVALPDGKMYVGLIDPYGPGLVRLNADGTRDADFVRPMVGGNRLIVRGIYPMADGKIIVRGMAAGVHKLVRLLENGETDATLISGDEVYGVAVQADGKIIVTGRSPSTGPFIKRIDADGVNDPTFAGAVQAAGAALEMWLVPMPRLILDELGRIYVAGGARPLARLINGPVNNSSVTVPAADRVQWQREGTAPEAHWVTFDLSENGGASWQRLGTAQRMAGGWELAGLSLPRQVMIRARARVRNGMVESIITDTVPDVPDLEVEHPQGNVIANGGTLQFPAVLPTQASLLNPMEIILRNVGDSAVTGLLLTPSDSQCEITVAPLATIGAAGEATAVLTFRPKQVGYCTAKVSIASNVPGAKNPYVLNLRGAGTAAPAIVTTPAAIDITQTQARLRGKVKANHDTAKVYFRYKRKTQPLADLVTVPAAGITVTGFDAVDVAHLVTGLTAGIQYHYQVIIYNSTSATPVEKPFVDFTTSP